LTPSSHGAESHGGARNTAGSGKDDRQDPGKKGGSEEVKEKASSSSAVVCFLVFVGF
jgi:hypothetical protein